MGAHSFLQIETLLISEDAIKQKDVIPDYVCFDIEDHFVVGYGLGYKEQGRGFKAIYTIV